MKKQIVFLATLTAIVSLAFAPTASAALISGGHAALATDGSDITGGASTSLVWAWNINGESDATVNGVTFSATQPGSVSIGGWSYNKHTADLAPTIAHYAGSDMQQLMGNLLGTASDSDDTMSLANLTVGKTYVLQVLQHQDINLPDRREGVIRFGNSTSSPALGVVFDHGDDYGRITTATFTADAATQSLYFDTGDTIDRVVINGIALYEAVPEPSSLALLSAASLIGMLAYAWRKRK